MEYNSFGNTDLIVSALGLGCSRLGGNLQSGDDNQAILTLEKALDTGINFYDTADSYGQGQSERLLGKVFKTQRDRVVFATKAGFYLSPIGNLATKVKPLIKPLVRILKPQNGTLAQAKGSLLRQNFSESYLVQSVEKSLRRLRTDYLDLFQLHNPPSEIIKAGDVFDTLATLKQQGKLRYYGVSCDTVEDALFCVHVPGVSALQVEINLLNQHALTELLPIAKQAGVAIIARQPFASGRLFHGIEDITVQSKVKLYQQLAKQYNSTLSHLALKFTQQLEGVSIVIAGANTPVHLIDNVNAIKSEPLSFEQMKGLIEMSAVTEP